MTFLKDPRKNLALGAGLFGFFVSFAALRWQESKLEDKSSLVPVLVTTQNLPAGARLESSLLKSRTMPRTYAPPGALTDPKEAEGMVTLSAMSAGEPILRNKIATGGSPFSSRIAAGRRAFTIPMDETSSMGGLVKAGDTADVLATFDVYQSEREFTNFTATLFQAVRILAVGSDFGDPEQGPGSGEDAGMSQGLNRPKTLTLDVSPEQAEVLLFCLSNGRVTLSLRGPGDLDFKDTATTTFEEILRRTGLSKARVQELPRRPAVEIIRGTKKN